MAPGGARIRSGPAADPNALARDYDGKDWIRLPECGRTADAPEWPIEFPNPSVLELHVWGELWKTPQALIWEIDIPIRNVALYARTIVAAGKPDGIVAKVLLAKQLGEGLLLSTMALRAAKVIIKGDPAEASLDGASAHRIAAKAAKRTSSVRDRLSIAPPPAEDEE